MQESPVEKINKQFETLATQATDFIIREYIPSKMDARVISYKNDVVENPNGRSFKAQKYFNYCQQYIAFFKSKSYQFLFKDYSLGRLVYEFDENDHLIAYNLYWNPCPFSLEYIEKIKQNEIDVTEFIDCMDAKDKLELNDIVLRTPIRLDFDSGYSGNNEAYHPLFHMHHQDKDTRACVNKPLSVYGYILFVLENCYPSIYQDKQYRDKIELLRKLDEDTHYWLKEKKDSGQEKLGDKIYTEIRVS